MNAVQRQQEKSLTAAAEEKAAAPHINSEMFEIVVIACLEISIDIEFLKILSYMHNSQVTQNILFLQIK